MQPTWFERYCHVVAFSTTTMFFAPLSTAARAALMPESPAPTMTMSASTVSLMSLSAMGLGAVKKLGPPAAVELCEQFIRTGAVLGLLVVFLPQNPERTVGLIVTGMILCELFSAVTLLLLARRHLNRAGGLTGAALRRRRGGAGE